MDVLHCGDIHLTGGMDTDAARALMTIADMAADFDVVHVNGDIFEKKSTPEQRLVFRRFIDRVRLQGNPLVIIRGNHDEPNDLAVFDDRQFGEVYVSERPEVITLKGGEYVVATVPHFNAAGIAAEADNHSQITELGNMAFEGLVESLWHEVALHTGIKALVFHGTIGGAQLDNGYIPRNNGICLALAQLEAFPGIVVCGHYHKYQDVKNTGRVFYSGSPVRHTFGETDDKGVLAVRYQGAGGVLATPYTTEFISLNPRAMYVVTAKFENGQVVYDDPAMAARAAAETGADVKIKLTLNQSDLAIYRAHNLADEFGQAETFKIDPVVNVDQTVRCARIATMADPDDIVAASAIWMENTGYDAETVARLRALLVSLLHNDPVETPQASAGHDQLALLAV